MKKDDEFNRCPMCDGVLEQQTILNRQWKELYECL